MTRQRKRSGTRENKDKKVTGVDGGGTERVGRRDIAEGWLGFRKEKLGQHSMVGNDRKRRLNPLVSSRRL